MIVERVTGIATTSPPRRTTDELLGVATGVPQGYIDPALILYAVRLATATRQPSASARKGSRAYNSFGASPRGSIHLIEAARALAFLRGRDYLLPEDVADLAPDVLRHRLVLTYEALADGKTPDDLILEVMRHVRAPDKPLETHVRAAAQS